TDTIKGELQNIIDVCGFIGCDGYSLKEVHKLCILLKSLFCIFAGSDVLPHRQNTGFTAYINMLRRHSYISVFTGDGTKDDLRLLNCLWLPFQTREYFLVSSVDPDIYFHNRST